MTPGNNALETALQTPRVQQVASVQVESPSYLSDSRYMAATLNATFDLVIFDQCSPRNFRRAILCSLEVYLLIGTNAVVIRKCNQGRLEIWTASRTSHHLGCQSSELDNAVLGNGVSIVEARTIDPGESGTVLMTSDIGPVFAVSPRGPFQDAVLGFSIVQATSDGMGAIRIGPSTQFSGVRLFRY